MALPFFYSEDILAGTAEHVLNEETSRHIVQVLRMKPGEDIHVTNGKGYIFLAGITDDNKKKVAVKIRKEVYQATPIKKISIAISLVKNASRFEWFLEKATEIGVASITPLLCQRTEKQHFRTERMRTIMISAMLQSRQAWLPLLNEPAKFSRFVSDVTAGQKFIAHCETEGDKDPILSHKPFNDALIIIGPEGDFTPEEISLALENKFMPVSLGETRLRTETAGIVAVTLLHNY